MSILNAIRVKLGLSNTPANNFTLTAEADNGTMKLARGNPGATTQDVIIVSAAGKVDFPQLARTLGITAGSSGACELPCGLLVKWGTLAGTGDVALTFPVAFPTACFGVLPVLVGSLGGSTSSTSSTVNSVTAAGCTIQKRFSNNGGLVGNASQDAFWIAIGV